MSGSGRKSLTKMLKAFKKTGRAYVPLSLLAIDATSSKGYKGKGIELVLVQSNGVHQDGRRVDKNAMDLIALHQSWSPQDESK